MDDANWSMWWHSGETTTQTQTRISTIVYTEDLR
jgi:hypothetical protein